jgi:hypothetical protein
MKPIATVGVTRLDPDSIDRDPLDEACAHPPCARPREGAKVSGRLSLAAPLVIDRGGVALDGRRVTCCRKARRPRSRDDRGSVAWPER